MMPAVSPSARMVGAERSVSLAPKYHVAKYTDKAEFERCARDGFWDVLYTGT